MTESFCKRLLVRQPRLVGAVVALGILFGVFVLGAQPFAAGLIPAPWDKLAHVTVFSVLAIAVGLASGLRGWRLMLVAVGGVLLIGALDEWHQAHLPGRFAGWDDWLADLLGALIGATVLGRVVPGERARGGR